MSPSFLIYYHCLLFILITELLNCYVNAILLTASKISSETEYLSRNMIVELFRRFFKYTITLLTLHGLSSFVYKENVSKVRVKTNKKLFIYSVIVSIFLNIFFVFGSMYVVYNYYQEFKDSGVVILIITLEFFFDTTKMVVISALHIIHRNKIVKLINELMKINKIVNQFTGITLTFNTKIRKIMKMKFCLIFLQIIFICFTLIAQSWFSWFILTYPQIITMLTTSIYIFGGMMMSLNYITCINTKLKFIEKNIKNKRLTVFTWNDDIDNVSALLHKINKFTINVNELYGIHLTLTLVGSMAIILCAVKFIK